jgi:hypothetical protein
LVFRAAAHNTWSKSFLRVAFAQAVLLSISKAKDTASIRAKVRTYVVGVRKIDLVSENR